MALSRYNKIKSLNKSGKIHRHGVFSIAVETKWCLKCSGSQNPPLHL